MSAERRDWLRVPIGDGSKPYITMAFTRTVLVVARTLTTTAWLLDFLEEVFADDPRVQVVFTIEDTAPSVYHEEARTLLDEVGARVLPWSQACATVFDLAICSTQNGSFHELRSPLFITPHGPGFGKPASVRPRGEVPRPIKDSLRNPSVPATTVVLSHQNQASLFDADGGEVQLLVAGDPAYDRLVASLPRRHQYRQAFRLRREQRLVVCSSTWGPGAQLGLLPDLALRLAGELPVDEFKVAMIIHPNIWFGHGPWQVRVWLRTAAEAGVVLIPPRGDEWRAAVLASDVLIADHGSVGFYGMAIGRPLLRSSFGEQYLRADAPLAELAKMAPELKLDDTVAHQIDRAIDRHDPARCRQLVDRMFDKQGEAVSIMRAAIYRLIGLSVGASGGTLAVSEGAIPMGAVHSHVVTGEVRHDASAQTTVAIRRLPAAADREQAARPTSSSREKAIPPRGGGGGGGGRHLVVDEAEQRARRRESASIITRAGTGTDFGSHANWAARVLEELPGCRLVATLNQQDGRALISGRDGCAFNVSVAPDEDGVRPSAAALASLIYLLDISDLLDTALGGPVSLRLDRGASEAWITPAPRHEP